MSNERATDPDDRARRLGLRRRRVPAAHRRRIRSSRSAASSRRAKPASRSAKTFPHLAPAYPDDAVRLARRRHRATRHGAALARCCPPRRTAPRRGLVDQLLTAAASAGVELVVVDASADFRFADAAAYAAVYGHPHETPARLKEFTLRGARAARAHRDAARGASRLLRDDDAARHRAARRARARRRVLRQRRHGQHRRRAHAARHDAPSLAAEQSVRVSGAEAPARPRGARARSRPRRAATSRLSFVPHSGPFARGIHATIFLHAKERHDARRRSTRRCASTIAARRSCASTTSRRR